MIVGLGTGSTARHFLDRLGERLKDGLSIRGVPTSERTAQHARRLGIPLLDWKSAASVDFAADGADQVDPQGQLLKGLGGALYREKIIAKATREFVVMIDSSKLVPILGAKCPVPVEVLPPKAGEVLPRLESLGARPILRQEGPSPFVTDNGNWIVDAWFEEIGDPVGLEERINLVDGVLENGIFTGLTDRVFVGDSGAAREWIIRGHRAPRAGRA
jgi:ribose 5-phosphate isomerase A